MFDITEKDIQRFWEKVRIGNEDECWPWMGALIGPNGYGSFTVSTGKSGGKKIPASRLSCFLEHGTPPQGWSHALHSCDYKPCCNPNHLRWGTPKHNAHDAIERGLHVPPPPVHSNPEWNAKRLAAMPKGENLHNQSLREEQAREIFRLHMSHHNVSQISEKTGIKKHVVADVCRGRSWQHLDGAPSLEELKQGGVRRGFNQFS